jgi:hypothetical protein
VDPDTQTATRRLLRWLGTQNRPVRYLACPIGCYGTRRYTATLTRLRAHDGDVVLGAAPLYRDQDHFEMWWPRLVPFLSAVSVLADTDGTVGRGVWVEVHDAWASGLPVRWEGPGRRRLLRAGDLVVVDGGESFRRYAQPAGRAA